MKWLSTIRSRGMLVEGGIRCGLRGCASWTRSALGWCQCIDLCLQRFLYSQTVLKFAILRESVVTMGSVHSPTYCQGLCLHWLMWPSRVRLHAHVFNLFHHFLTLVRFYNFLQIGFIISSKPPRLDQGNLLPMPDSGERTTIHSQLNIHAGFRLMPDTPRG